MKNGYRVLALTAVALTAGGIYAAANSDAARARRRRKFVAKAMRGAGSVIDHISAFM